MAVTETSLNQMCCCDVACRIASREATAAALAAADQKRTAIAHRQTMVAEATASALATAADMTARRDHRRQVYATIFKPPAFYASHSTDSVVEALHMPLTSSGS